MLKFLYNIYLAQQVNLESVSIPGNVESIGDYAFAYCNMLSNIKLGTGLISIGESAFSGCYKISQIELPDKITSIGNYAFSRCNKLKSISFPNSITSIGRSVFEACTSLEAVEIGQKLLEISGDVFNNCPKLTNITISESNPNLLAENNIVFNKTKTKLIYYAAATEKDKYLIPETVTEVGNHAFSYTTELKELRIPASVTKIGYAGIYHNEQLSKVLFYGKRAPEITSVSSYEHQTYFYRNGSICYNNSVKGNGSYDNSNLMIYILKDAKGFDKGWNEFPKNYDNKGSNVKYEWTEKSQIYYWDPNKTDNTKGNFGSLEWYYRDDIGELSFKGSGNTGNFTLENLPTWVAENNDSGITDHMQDIQRIDTTDAKSVEIGDYTFYGASRLACINSGKELKSVGNSTFEKCTSLKLLSIQDTSDIGSSAFLGDTSLENEADLRGAVTIGNNAFKQCTKLQGALLGDSLQSLGTGCFSDCSALNNIILPEKLTTLPEAGFSGCTSLRTINIPKAVMTVDKDAFKGNTGLKKVYFYGDYPEIADDAFEGCNEELKIYYRKGNESWKNSVTDGRINGIAVEGLDKFYTGRKDTYSFANTGSSFGYWADYYIPRQRYVTAVQSIIRGSYYYALSEVWKGSCFGMAASSLEFYQGDNFDIKNYNSQAQSLYDVKRPAKSDAALTKIIEIYQVSQFADEISDEIALNSQKYRKLIQQVEEFERSGGLNIDEDADPVVLCVYSNYTGHALVPVSVDNDSYGNYIMKVYDCNYPDSLRTLKVKKDFSGIDYDGGLIKYKSASFVKYSTIRDALEKADFTGEHFSNETNTRSVSGIESTKVAVAVNSENVKIENTGGRDIKEIKGAYEQHPMSDGKTDEFSGIRSFVLPIGEYNVKSTSNANDNNKQEPLTYYTATEDLYSKIETSDASAELMVKSVEGKGEDTIALTSESEKAVSKMTIMNTNGIENSITVTGSAITATVRYDDTISLEVSDDIKEVTVNDKVVPVDSEGEVTGIKFKATHKVTLEKDEGISEVHGEGSYEEGESYTISATVADGYEWVKWSDGDTNINRTLVMKTEDVSLRAITKKKESTPEPIVSTPTPEPTSEPTVVNPTPEPTPEPIMPTPTLVPTTEPIVTTPTPVPTIQPIIATPTPVPTIQPIIVTSTPAATPAPTIEPIVPSQAPVETTEPSETAVPVPTESAEPAIEPTIMPVEPEETVEPTTEPTAKPTVKPANNVKKGQVVKSGKAKYTVTKVSGKTGTVSLYKPVNSKEKNVKVPKQIKISEKVYKVTAIGDNAFKNAKKLKSIVISENVTKIGKTAFSGCKNLGSITIKSNNLKTIQKNAFKNIKDKVKVILPKKKYKKYKKLLDSKGKLSEKAVYKKK